MSQQIAFYTGTSGMIAYQRALDVSAHNLANVNTYGYKTRRATFEDLLRSRVDTNVPGEHLVGHGVKMENVDLIMEQSSLDITNNAMDFAIEGDGFFQIDVGGAREYTRNGAFYLSVEGNTATVVTGDGAYVLDKNGARITLTADANGQLDTSGLPDRFGVYNFANPYGLDEKNAARFAATDSSGPAVAVAAGGATQVISGAVENSSVNLGDEMVRVIMTQRAFQINSRVVQTADQLADIVNNLR